MPRQGAPVTVVNTTGAPIQTTPVTAAGTAAPVGSQADPVYTSSAIPLGTGTDRSGTNAATTFVIAAANAARTRLDFQNTSDTEMRVSEITTSPASATNGYRVAPTFGFSVATNQAFTGYCAATGKTYQATEK